MCEEHLTRQAVPEKEYLVLLGTAIVVFNSNNAFIIENILAKDTSKQYSWYELIDNTSGTLLDPIKKTITKFSNDDISNKFEDLVNKRNRIIHSFRITDTDGKTQILRTKEKNGKQYNITKEYLLTFIKDNEELSSMLHKFREY